jgi:hypothetical protein
MLTVGFLVLLALSALAALAFSRSPSASGTATIPYQQRGSFTYSSQVTPNAAYPGGRVTTGDPIFVQLVHTLHAAFAYRFSSATVHRASGTASLDMVLKSSTGWHRTIALQAPQPFAGDRTSVGGTISVTSLPSLLAQLESTTDVSGSYTLSLVPHVRIHGELGTAPFQSTFSTPLTFELNPAELQVQGSSASTTSAFRPTTSGSVPDSKPQPTYLSFKLAKLRVSEARDISLPAIVATMLALIGAFFGLGRSRAPVDESTDIQARYHDWLVPVTAVARPLGRQVIEVDDMEALARIAERYERMILHEVGQGFDTFTVADDGVLYQYVAATEIVRQAGTVHALQRTA